MSVKLSKNKVAAGEQFQLSYQIEGAVSNFKQPDLKEFTILSGPNQSSSFQVYNNVMSQSLSVYYILSAKKEGTFTIGPAGATCSGKKIESDKISIEVVKANPQVQMQTNGNYGNSYGNNANTNIQQYSIPGNNNINPPNGGLNKNYTAPITAATPTTKDYFIRYGVSKQKVYVGEQVTLDVKLYTRLDVRGPDDFTFPTLDGFWKFDAPKSTDVKRTRENVDGIAYTVYTIYENFLFPQKTGKLTIDPATMKCRVLKPYEKTGNWWDDAFNAGMVREVSVSLETAPVEITVDPLPETGKPENFSGAVGTYTMKSEITREKMKENDAFNIRLTVSGRGNLKLVDPPSLDLPEGFEALTPKAEDKLGVSDAGVSGSKIFDYSIIAREQGTDTIPSTNFSFFDLEKKSYVSLSSPDFIVKVLPGDPGQAPQVVKNFADPQQEVVVKDDIRHIKTGEVQLLSRAPFFGSVGYTTLMLASPALFLLLLLVRRRREKERADVAGTKSRLAGKVARKHLSSAENFMRQNEVDHFYEELLRTVHSYLSNKLGMLTGELSADTIRQALLNRKASEESVNALMNVIADAEYARFAPPGGGSEMQRSYTAAFSCIDKFEEEIK